MKGPIGMYAPLDGHRGGLYLGDLIKLVQDAAYRSDVQWITSKRSQSYHGAPQDSVSLIVGRPQRYRYDESSQHTGHILNIIQGTVPEWDHLEDLTDPESGLECHGWRFLLRRCLHDKIIRATAAVVEMLGESDCMRWKASV